MKRFILNLFIFVVLVFAFIKVTGLYDNRDRLFISNGDASKAAKMHEFDSLDILFLGNSYCYSSVVTPLINAQGLRTFNLGIATASSGFYTVLMEDYLKSVSKKPDTIMIMLSAMLFSSESDNWEKYPIHRYLNYPVSNEALVTKLNCYDKYPSLLFNSCRKGITNLTARGQKQPDSTDFDYLYIDAGFYIDSTVTSDSLERSMLNFYKPLAKDHFNQTTAKQILQLAATLSEQGIAVLFFEPPSNKLKSFFNAAYTADYEKFCADLGTKYKFIRTSEAYPAQYFRNHDHTNTQGAYKFTHYLMKELKNE